MLSPERIDRLADSIVHAHQEAFVRDLVRQLVRALAADGELSAVDMQTLARLSDMNRSQITVLLNRYRHRMAEDVRRELIAALEESARWDITAVSAVRAGAITPEMSARFARVASETAEGLARIIARDNLQMAMRAQLVWFDVTGEAIARYNNGAYPTARIISDAVKRLRREGLRVIDYRSGVTTRIDAAVRRHVVSQAGQVAGRITEEILDATDHPLVLTSAHFGARPDHAVWQGRVFRRGGAGLVDGVYYPGFESSTGYGSVTGLLGVNCRHSFGPHWPGITEPTPLPDKVAGMDNDAYYDAVQKQRGYERAVRVTKEQIADLQLAGGDATALRRKLGKQQRRLKDYCDKTGIPRHPSRERAYGIGGQPRALGRRAS